VSRKIAIDLTVNGRAISAECEPRLLLSDFLRHQLGLTGTHVGCEQGACGACTVIIDGAPARSCLTLAVQAKGATVLTVEGLVKGPADLNEAQRAMGAAFALQCGFCTPGIVMSLTSALDRTDLDEDTINDLLGGHICRCTGYQGLRAAAAAIVAARKERAP
jgi:aerobic-type carbon monoxide dehydrogenase small subunit (CoxS/CutS family)